MPKHPKFTSQRCEAMTIAAAAAYMELRMGNSPTGPIWPNHKSPSQCRAAKEIAFIDPAVSDVEVLLAGLRAGVHPILLNTVEPVPRQIASALAGCRSLDAIHIIAHGAPGGR